MSNLFQIVPTNTFFYILNKNNFSDIDFDEDYRTEQNWIDFSIQSIQNHLPQQNSIINRQIQNIRQTKTNAQRVIVDSESSDGNNKLAKNRESAHNYRIRKKIYIVLLDNQVKELTEQLQQLEYEVQQNKIKYIKLENFIGDYHRSIREQVFSIEKLKLDNCLNIRVTFLH